MAVMQQRRTNLDDNEEDEEAGAVTVSSHSPLHGDVLELTLSHVPLVDLVPAARVSRSWSLAVSSSLSHFRKPKPWLLVHYQSTRSPHVVSTRAYDPRSRVWMDLEVGPDRRQPAATLASALRSSHSTLLYGLSPARLSFSSDPLHLTWRHASPPSAWRVDPVVALVGSRLVVAGGACDFEDDPLSVEVYDTQAHTWSVCASMPAPLKDSSASVWLSVAADRRRMYAMEKLTGATHAFDPEVGAWRGPYDLRPDRDAFYSVIGFAGDRLVVLGLLGNSEDVKGVKLWGSIGVGADKLEEICEMPEELVKELKDDNCCVSSISMCSRGDFVFVYSNSKPEIVFWCEREDESGVWRWGTARDAAARGRNLGQRVAYTCAEVGIRELREAAATGNGRFVVMEGG
ncbi:F-box domain-containing protein [Psidium guajava]|nr:F-box domain-containing protein [Psidium guajava]